MSVSAIIVVSSRSLVTETSDERSPLGDTPASPIACLKVLGESILQRTIGRLHSAGVKRVSVLSETGLDQSFVLDALTRQASKGCKKVLLMRMGAYAEVDYAELLKFHHEAGATVTRVCDHDGPLDFWALNPTPVLQQGMNFDSSPEFDGDQPLLYLTRGYVNRLADARSIRRLAIDSFLGHCEMRPVGREAEPGVWIGHGARVHNSARIVAPAYVGRGSRVRASVLMTQFSTLEQCCEVDRGTHVDDASILPDTYVGKALELAHAVVDGNTLVHLPSEVAIKIDDAKIIGRVSPGWNSFRYGDKEQELMRPSTKPVEPEQITYAPQRPHAALRIFSKGEV